jgi:hypothetical protein
MPASSRPVRIQPFLATTGLLFLVCPAAGQGQSLSQGAYQAEITLATGVGVPDAFVTIEDEAGTTVRRVKTESRGLFTIPPIAPGTCAVLIEKTGFQPFRQTPLGSGRAGEDLGFGVVVTGPFAPWQKVDATEALGATGARSRGWGRARSAITRFTEGCAGDA